MKALFLFFIFLSAFVSCGEANKISQCENGFEFVNEKCADINECNLNTDNCDENADCMNNPGGFYCQCLVGFTGNGKTCTDVNECVAQSDNCDENAMCSNTAGSFSCVIMDIYEVTAGEFTQCVTAGNCTSTNYKTNSQQSSCNLNKVGNENHPMNCVNWFGADEYCRWKGKMLPTETEWVFAAKGGETYIYSGSNNIDDVAWYGENSGNTTHIVGIKAANGYGLYDMSGNVWEWTNSWWDSSNMYYILRGGSFYDNSYDIQVDYRFTNDTNFIHQSYGFRCLKSQ